MTELDILLPFGLPPAALSADLLRELHTPALAALLARARMEPHETFDDFQRALPHEIWLSRAFGIDAGTQASSPPVAQALMRETGRQPAAADAWFILQPVHIHIARDHLVLTDPRQLALDENEALTLFDIAKPLFAETGKELVFGDARTWFVRAEDWSELLTASPDAASGHNIDIWMPRGPKERDWRKVQNDVQMHWFNHPVNEAREMRGERPVNSVWLWGGPSPREWPASGNYGSYEKAFNLSGWMRAFRQSARQHLDAAHAANLIPGLTARNFLLLDELLEPALTNDWARWLDVMRKFEEQWFAPLLQSLKSGALDRVSLILTNDTRISHAVATRSSLRKFWVKPSLAKLCP